jgi:hypothetical protein
MSQSILTTIDINVMFILKMSSCVGSIRRGVGICLFAKGAVSFSLFASPAELGFISHCVPKISPWGRLRIDNGSRLGRSNRGRTRNGHGEKYVSEV